MVQRYQHRISGPLMDRLAGEEGARLILTQIPT
jgi:hypothetical protein